MKTYNQLLYGGNSFQNPISVLYPDIHTFLLTAGPITVEVPVSMSGQSSLTQWTAVLERSVPSRTGPRALSVSLSSPASASIGVYTLQMRVEARLTVKTHSLGQFTLLCNPWCQGECCLCVQIKLNALVSC